MFQFDCYSERKLSEKDGGKLDNSLTAPKAYRSIFNFLGSRKTTNIPPFIVNDFVILDFTTKATLFNNFFASQYCPVVSSSTLPNFPYKTETNK